MSELARIGVQRVEVDLAFIRPAMDHGWKVATLVGHPEEYLAAGARYDEAGVITNHPEELLGRLSGR